jgi:hypothetical protein
MSVRGEGIAKKACAGHRALATSAGSPALYLQDECRDESLVDRGWEVAKVPQDRKISTYVINTLPEI